MELRCRHRASETRDLRGHGSAEIGDWLAGHLVGYPPFDAARRGNGDDHVLRRSSDIGASGLSHRIVRTARDQCDRTRRQPSKRESAIRIRVGRSRKCISRHHHHRLGDRGSVVIRHAAGDFDAVIDFDRQRRRARREIVGRHHLVRDRVPSNHQLILAFDDAVCDRA